jgi:cysteine synthase A
MIYNNILETIGNTPVVRLNRMGPDHVDMYVKVESFNPMASVKDRLAFAIVNDAERKGTLKPGQTVIEATSGNTGIALAMVAGDGLRGQGAPVRRGHGRLIFGGAPANNARPGR